LTPPGRTGMLTWVATDPLKSKAAFVEHVTKVHGWEPGPKDEVFDLRLAHGRAHREQKLDHDHTDR
jgi:hypothetical protein